MTKSKWADYEPCERQLMANESRRNASEDRYLERLERRMKAAEALIGELVRDGKTVYYINLMNKAGDYTGKTKESSDSYELTTYLLRNGYV